MMDIRLAHVRKSYGEKQVLQDLCCVFPKGRICAVTGPSGAGKTTLLRLLLELERPDSGSISGLPQRKSAVFQEDRLCPGLSILGNLRMALPDYNEAEARALLNILGLGDSLLLPAAQLSGGMARRAALARALLCGSDLLTLDEPFNGMDGPIRKIAAEAILSCQGGRTILLVTHRQEELDLLQPEICIPL